MLDHRMAQRIAEKTTDICGYPVTIIDSSGLIIGSSDRSRINTIHGGIDAVFQHKQLIEHDEEEVKDIPGAYAGIACPIVFTDNVIGAVGIRGNPDIVRGYIQLIKNQVEMMYQQRLHFELSKIRSDAFDLFIQELLYGQFNSGQMKSLAQVNNINLDLRRYAFAIKVTDKTARTQPDNLDHEKFLEVIHNVIDSITEFLQEPQTIVCHTNNDIVSIFKRHHDASTPMEEFEELYEFLKRKHDLQFLVGAGGECCGITSMRSAYQGAHQALSIADRLGYSEGILSIQDLFVERILLEVKKEVVDDITLDPSLIQFLSPRNKGLHETLYCLCDNDLNITQTAKKLYIHRNTLLYRLKKMKQITGLDPLTFRHAMTLLLLLHMQKLS
ncbi:CdaR family transcriptional regulator [Bacillus piscicola]|uniref:CdaR family transcriptional regulator n=1 Tax=Bacillus piscicola TaxID=1632684 RepID=UPI001F08901A|nr:sugar diacid recognition domain-containing protein [Bacillus piscicola]